MYNQVHHTCVMNNITPGKILSDIGLLLKVAALAAGPYAHMISVLGNIVQESSANSDWFKTILAALIVSYVIGSFTLCVVSYTIWKGGYGKRKKSLERDWLERHCLAYGYNLAHTVTITILIMHVLGPNESFTVVISIITLLIQQSLSYKNITNSTGYLPAIVIVVLWLTPQDEYAELTSARHTCLIKNESTNGANLVSLYLLCVLIGMATQAHIMRITESSHAATGLQHSKIYFAAVLFLHVACFLPSALWPMLNDDGQSFYTRACDTKHTGYFRLIMSITSLLLSTASERPNSVYQIMSGDTAAVCATIILTINFSVYGTIYMFYSLAVVVLMIFLYRV